MNTTQKWTLHTTDHNGSLPRPKNKINMWVQAFCSTAEIAADTGGGLNFLVTWTHDDGWVIENWIEPIDELPEFPDNVYEKLFRSFSGELEIEC